MNLKGCNLELAHRNSQASIPFYVSSLATASCGTMQQSVRFIRNKHNGMAGTHHKAARLRVTAGDTPAEIEEHFADAIGKVPMMPEYGLGFWQVQAALSTTRAGYAE